jgi:hypothetical protein
VGGMLTRCLNPEKSASKAADRSVRRTRGLPRLFSLPELQISFNKCHSKTCCQ